MTNAENKDQVRPKRRRSPNFPAISLRKAADLAKTFFDKYKHNQLSIGLSYVHWGYKASSSLGHQVVAALRAYGLIDVHGVGSKRQVKISDLGHKIVANHPDRQALLRKAALKPPLFEELWEKYRGQELPPDEVITEHLLWHREEGLFNPESIATFIAAFRDTISFAELAVSDIIPGNSEQSHTGIGGRDAQEQFEERCASLPPRLPEMQTREKNMAIDTFTLEEGTITFQYPTSLSKESFEDLEALMKLQLKKIQRHIKTDLEDDPVDNEG